MSDANGLTIRTENSGDNVVLRLRGDIDMSTSGQLDHEAHRALEQHPPVLVLDLREVRFLGSAGIASLITAQDAGHGTTSVRIVAGHAVARLIRIAGLGPVFPVYPDLAQVFTDR